MKEFFKVLGQVLIAPFLFVFNGIRGFLTGYLYEEYKK